MQLCQWVRTLNSCADGRSIRLKPNRRRNILLFAPINMLQIIIIIIIVVIIIIIIIIIIIK
jgi:hypothetical protein